MKAVDAKRLDKLCFLVYIYINDRVADTCEACNLKRAPAGALLFTQR